MNAPGVDATTTARAASPEAGLMMDFPLTTQHLLWRMEHVFPTRQAISIRDASGAASSTSFADIARHARRLAAALTRFGVRPGDRVGSLLWNSAEHLEVYYGVMGMGAVLHTINLRLGPDQLAWTINDAQDRVLIVESSLLPLIEAVQGQLDGVDLIIVVGPGEADAHRHPLHDYTRLLDDVALDGFEWPPVEERSGAALCYTSGTTGNPKGVLYSHRSIALHSLITAGAGVYGVTRSDRVLAAVPMFHALGWSLPFVCAIAGADIILPGSFLQPASLARTIEDHKITWSCGVPTIWTDLLRHLEQTTVDGGRETLSSLERVISGGTIVPLDLMRRYREVDVEFSQGWGMTETLTGVAVTADDPADSAETYWAKRSIAGQVSPFYEFRIVDDNGDVLPNDGAARGEIQVRGPVVASAYVSADGARPAAASGWFATGDLGTLSADSSLTIVDRLKDMIKSGGEWISSAEVESALMSAPGVRDAAVIARPDPRWSERPHAFVVVDDGVTTDAILEFVDDRIPRWWVPDVIEAVDSIPRTTTGKQDKKLLRSRVRDAMEAHSD